MSSRKKRSPEEQARRAKIRELLELSEISSMEDIQSLFKGKPSGNSWRKAWTLNWRMNWATASMTTGTKRPTTAGMARSSKTLPHNFGDVGGLRAAGSEESI